MNENNGCQSNMLEKIAFHTDERSDLDPLDPPDIREGEYSLALNTKYSGSWDCGLMSGEGTMTSPLGVYDGMRIHE